MVYKVRKEGNVLFNDALSTFLFMVIWLLTYGKGERKSIAATEWATRSDSKQVFYMHYHTDRIAHTTTFVTESWRRYTPKKIVSPQICINI